VEDPDSALKYKFRSGSASTMEKQGEEQPQPPHVLSPLEPWSPANSVTGDSLEWDPFDDSSDPLFGTGIEHPFGTGMEDTLPPTTDTTTNQIQPTKRILPFNTNKYRPRSKSFGGICNIPQCHTLQRWIHPDPSVWTRNHQSQAEW